MVFSLRIATRAAHGAACLRAMGVGTLCTSQNGGQWHSFSGFFHSVKDSVLGLGYPLIFYSVSELPVPVLLFLAATFRPVFGIAAHRTCPDGAVADTGRSR